jgi:hypothetical protein
LAQGVRDLVAELNPGLLDVELQGVVELVIEAEIDAKVAVVRLEAE